MFISLKKDTVILSFLKRGRERTEKVFHYSFQSFTVFRLKRS
jgi:hypothetical protein